MMKASGFWQTLLGLRHVYLLHLVLMITGFSPGDTGHFPPVLYNGVVGGNISFLCPINTTKKLEFLYFQKVENGEYTFFNGYYDSKPLNPLPNTKMDQNNTIMHIYGLTLSSSGEYQCYYRYKDASSPDPIMVKIHLNVTAVFSKPVITVRCNEESSIQSECPVTCESHNGLPGQKMKWNVTGNISKEMWKIVNNIEVLSSEELVNISSTANFNCSGGNVMVSCYVDEVTSEIISVCSPKPHPVQPGNPSTIVLVAAVVCSLVVVITFVLLYLRQRTTGTSKGSVVRNMAENGQPEEVIVLNNTRQEQMGS